MVGGIYRLRDREGDVECWGKKAREVGSGSGRNYEKRNS